MGGPSAVASSSSLSPVRVAVSSSTSPLRRSSVVLSSRIRPQRRSISLLDAARLQFTPQGKPDLPAGVPQTASPLGLIKDELSSLRSNVSHLLGSGHPVLDTVAKYYFQAEGKHVRPTIVLLMSQATNGLGSDWAELRGRDQALMDEFVSARSDVLNDYNPGMPESATSFADVFVPSGSPSRPSPPPPITRLPDPSPYSAVPMAERTLANELLPTQKRLAEITEMLHVATLLHDDVIDESPTRRGEPSAPSQFGNKVSILTGDFLLGRASAGLTRLGSQELVELMSTVIANLVEGEIMQLKATSNPETRPTKEGFDRYLQKTYLKTASLMAKSARSAVLLGGAGRDEGLKDVAYAYGRNLGLAFQVRHPRRRHSEPLLTCLLSQLVDDLLDFTPTPSTSLGKPSAGFDLSLGLATAPLLFAWESNPSLTPLIARRFAEPGDVALVRDLVLKSDGMDRTRALARKYAEEAKRVIRERLPPSEAREGLEGLAEQVVDRCK